MAYAFGKLPAETLCTAPQSYLRIANYDSANILYPSIYRVQETTLKATNLNLYDANLFRI